MFNGLLKYFPDALAYVAHVSHVGNEQHNPGEPLHWAREKSTDHGDCIIRHQVEAGMMDDDGLLHDGKVAWRALAQLQLELERRGMAVRPVGEAAPRGSGSECAAGGLGDGWECNNLSERGGA